MNAPLISVIVPVYKTELYLKRCLDSIINQTYSNLEIILINDGSPDNCRSICDEYKQKDNRITVIHQQNQGQGTARNNGIKIATGDYISFVDSDDYLDLTTYEQTMNFMLENKLDIVCFNFYTIYNDNEFYAELNFEKTQIFTKEKTLIHALKNDFYPGVCNKIYKSTIVKKLSFSARKNNR